MLRHHHPSPLAARFEADGPITPELLAVVARQPLELAASYAGTWFREARSAADAGFVLVFDELVIGAPCPLLLEAAHQVREVRRYEHLGRFDEEEERWYAQHEDDDDVDFWEAPTTVDRVLAAMADGQESERLVEGALLARAVSRRHDPRHAHWVTFVRLALAMEHLLVALATGVRIGAAVVVDARLPGERLDDGRWAA